MRQLGHGQSVMFFAPLEVDRSIRKAANKNSSDRVSVLDILRWTMLETCEDIQHHVPHWAQQGADYRRRKDAWLKFPLSDNLSVEKLKASWLQPEARTLETMYGYSSIIGGRSTGTAAHHAALDVPEIYERCWQLGVLSLSDTRTDEEQEREVNHEAERERDVERPSKAEAATHRVHEDVRGYVKRGVVPMNSSAFIPAFFPLWEASPRDFPWSPCLLTTKDCSITIGEQFRSTGQYLRPVNWIISSTGAQGRTILVIISPYEANELLPEIRKSKAVHLHQYLPRVTQSMKSFDDLSFHCIPPLPPSWEPPTPELVIQLGLWAGQLYFPNHETYLQLCAFLGVYTRPAQDGSGGIISIQHDGFIKPAHRRGAMASLCPFTESPLPFLKELTGQRRKGMGYLSTHLGKVLHGRLLTEEDFKY